MSENKKMQLSKVSLQTLPIDVLLPATNPLQIMQRTTPGALKSLVAQIEKTKTIIPPTVTRSRSKIVVIDGHRRIASAASLGIKELQCTIIESEHAAVDFLRLNLGRKNFDGRTWLQIWKIAEDREMVLRECSDYTAARIRSLMKSLGGPKAFEELIDEINSPNIIDWIEKLTQLFRDAGIKYDRKSVTVWCIRNSVKAHVMTLNGLSPAMRKKHLVRIMDSIVSGRPYTKHRSVSYSRVSPVAALAENVM